MPVSRKRKQQLSKARHSAPTQRWSATEASSSHESSVASPTLHVEDELIPIPVSASKQKLEYFATESASDTDNQRQEPMIVTDFELLRSLFVSLVCPECLTNSLDLVCSPKRNTGLAVFLRIICKFCKRDISSTFTSRRLTEDSSFDINRRMVAASLTVGISQEGLGKFSENVGVPKLHHKTFSVHVKKIHSKIGQFKKKVTGKAVEVIRKQSSNSVETGERLDIDVGYDGSWHTKGHKSQRGIGCIIENTSGLVDYHVMTRFCQARSVTGERLKKESEEKYALWYAIKNHEGSAGSMEQAGAVTMWAKSEEYHNLRYRSVICDGDTNTIKELHKLDPYEGLVVEKLECINHVSKRVGKALKTLVDTKRKQKITLGGRGKGQLTEKKMMKLQKYYRKAVMSNESVDSMKKAIWATFKHCTSTDDDPHHKDCPQGNNSHCFYQRAIARKIPVPQHTEETQGTFLNEKVASYVKEVYERLTEDDLLKRCLQSKTQNVNESIRALIWACCPKHIFVQRQRMEIAVAVGVAEFNMGSKGTQLYLTELGLEVRAMTERLGEKRDTQRVRKAEKAVCVDVKRRRTIIRNARAAEHQELEEREGGAQYVAGGF